MTRLEMGLGRGQGEGEVMAAGESGIHLCVFDLDHTLVRSDLDLDRMKRDVASHLRRRGVGLAMGEPLPPIAELLRAAEVHDGRHGSRVAAEVWQIVAEHERRALAAAREEPGARETLGALRARGCWVAVWTNNASATAAEALARAGLAGLVDVLVGRDDAGALKPAPDGFKVILDRLAAVAGCRHARVSKEGPPPGGGRPAPGGGRPGSTFPPRLPTLAPSGASRIRCEGVEVHGCAPC
ncbi:MAG: HAD hydrolase-like protein, partial [Symbiobacteriaceae bacterium]